MCIVVHRRLSHAHRRSLMKNWMSIIWPPLCYLAILSWCLNYGYDILSRTSVAVESFAFQCEWVFLRAFSLRACRYILTLYAEREFEPFPSVHQPTTTHSFVILHMLAATLNTFDSTNFWQFGTCAPRERDRTKLVYYFCVLLNQIRIQRCN